MYLCQNDNDKYRSQQHNKVQKSTRNKVVAMMNATNDSLKYINFYLFGSNEGPDDKQKDFGLSPSSNFFHRFTTSKP